MRHLFLKFTQGVVTYLREFDSPIECLSHPNKKSFLSPSGQRSALGIYPLIAFDD